VDGDADHNGYTLHSQRDKCPWLGTPVNNIIRLKISTKNVMDGN